ncbi:MAG: hypothetical protein R3E90_07090 [Marinicella sp.]
MKKIMLFCVIGFWSSASFTKLSCDELTTSLDHLAEALASVEKPV